MKKTIFPPWIATGMLVASLFLPVPLTFAQTMNPTPETRVVETRTAHDRTGLWGLARVRGLTGAHRPGAPSRGGAPLNGPP